MEPRVLLIYIHSFFSFPCVSIIQLQTCPVILIQNMIFRISIHIVIQGFMCVIFSKSVRYSIESGKSWFTLVFTDLDFKRQMSVSKERAIKAKNQREECTNGPNGRWSLAMMGVHGHQGTKKVRLRKIFNVHVSSYSVAPRNPLTFSERWLKDFSSGTCVNWSLKM